MVVNLGPQLRAFFLRCAPVIATTARCAETLRHQTVVTGLPGNLFDKDQAIGESRA
jgi:hypothetical protein